MKLPYYDRDGKPISMEEYCALREREDYWRVAQHQIGDVWISTVWLGIDHRFGDKGPPIIFETMAFLDTDVETSERLGPDDYQERYATLKEARLGHERIVSEYTKKARPEGVEPSPSVLETDVLP